MRVEDSSGHLATRLDDRKQLVTASKQTDRRYRDAGVKVVPGRGGAGLIVAGAAAATLGYGAMSAAVATSALGGGAAGGGAAAAAGGLFLAAPVLIGMGVARAVNNRKVDARIQARATRLPMALDPGTSAELDLFYPISPSPRRVIILYSDAQGDHQLEIDTRQVLSGLHLPADPAAHN